MITWTGQVAAGSPVTIRFNVTVDSSIDSPQTIVNVVQLDDGLGHILERQATVLANGLATYLPIVSKDQ